MWFVLKFTDGKPLFQLFRRPRGGKNHHFRFHFSNFVGASTHIAYKPLVAQSPRPRRQRSGTATAQAMGHGAHGRQNLVPKSAKSCGRPNVAPKSAKSCGGLFGAPQRGDKKVIQRQIKKVLAPNMFLPVFCPHVCSHFCSSACKFLLVSCPLFVISEPHM